jgi:hypothetical protein
MTTETTTQSENINPKTSGNIAVKWGFIGGLLSIIIGLAMFYAYGGALEKVNRGVQFALSLILAFAITFMAMKEKRESLGGFITYGKAFKTGFMASLIIVLLAAIYMYVLFNFLIDFDTMTSSMLDETIKTMKDQGKSDQEIEQALYYSKKFMNPTSFLIWGTVSNLITYTIVNLISAAIAKRNPPQA